MMEKYKNYDFWRCTKYSEDQLSQAAGDMIIQSQGNNSVGESSPSRDSLPVESIIEDLQTRIRKLERWHTVNT
ncbi:hypothetical protein MKW98_025856, partial [Papaver atlanticum]